MVEEIETIETANHWNQLDKERLESICRNVTNRLPGLDHWQRTCERRIAAIPRNRGAEYLRERSRDVREECHAEALATVEPFLNLRGVASSQRTFHSREAKLESAKLHEDAATNATMILAEQGENRNADGPGLVRRAEKAAADGNWARLILGEVTARGDSLPRDTVARIEQAIGEMAVDAPELTIIDELERSTFEMFARLSAIRYGARKYSYEELGKMSPKLYQEVRRRQKEAGIRQ